MPSCILKKSGRRQEIDVEGHDEETTKISKRGGLGIKPRDNF